MMLLVFQAPEKHPQPLKAVLQIFKNGIQSFHLLIHRSQAWKADADAPFLGGQEDHPRPSNCMHPNPVLYHRASFNERVC